MLLSTFSTSLTADLTWSIIILVLMSQTVQAFVASEIFKIKSGTTSGGCDNYNVNEWYQDALTLANSALACIDAAVEAKDNEDVDADSQKYIFTFFNVKSSPNNFKARAATIRKNLQEVIKALEDDEPGDYDDKPWIFCDSTWAEQKAWDSIAQVTSTGATDPDNRKISEVLADEYDTYYVKRQAAIANAKTEAAKKKLDQPLYPFWSTDLMKYVFDVDGDYCSTGANLGGTDDNDQPNTITFCPGNWNSEQYATLASLPSVTTNDESIENLQVKALTFFHEMIHYALENLYTPDHAYKLTEIVRQSALEKTGKYITQAQSLQNPESYTLFALAYYLGTKNTGYTFASSASVAIE